MVPPRSPSLAWARAEDLLTLKESRLFLGAIGNHNNCNLNSKNNWLLRCREQDACKCATGRETASKSSVPTCVSKTWLRMDQTWPDQATHQLVDILDPNPREKQQHKLNQSMIMVGFNCCFPFLLCRSYHFSGWIPTENICYHVAGYTYIIIPGTSRSEVAT